MSSYSLPDLGFKLAVARAFLRPPAEDMKESSLAAVIFANEGRGDQDSVWRKVRSGARSLRREERECLTNLISEQWSSASGKDLGTLPPDLFLRPLHAFVQALHQAAGGDAARAGEMDADLAEAQKVARSFAKSLRERCDASRVQVCRLNGELFGGGAPYQAPEEAFAQYCGGDVLRLSWIGPLEGERSVFMMTYLDDFERALERPLWDCARVELKNARISSENPHIFPKYHIHPGATGLAHHLTLVLRPGAEQLALLPKQTPDDWPPDYADFWWFAQALLRKRYHADKENALNNLVESAGSCSFRIVA